MKLKHRVMEWISRINGVQPWGISWQTTPTQRTVISALIVEFENHRVLWDSGCGQDRQKMIESIEVLRVRMTEAIQQLREESATRTAVQHLRDCCIDFQSWLERDGFSIDGFGAPSEDFYVYIGMFRWRFGRLLRFISIGHSLKPNERLSKILPKGSSDNQLL